MKRELMTVLIGAAILLPVDAEAQRNRARNGNRDNRSERVTQPAPVRANGRIAYRGRTTSRALPPRTRVIYSNRGGYIQHRQGNVWIRADWGRPARWQAPRYRARYDRELKQKDLRDILGKRTLDRVKDEARRAGVRGKMRGRWINARNDGLILVITVDRVAVAEFVDYDHDGRIDDAFVIDRRSGRLEAIGW